MSRARSHWRQVLAASLTDPNTLPLPERTRRRAARAAARYPMRIPPRLARRIDWSNPRCPLRRQLLPDPRELAAGGAADPLDEERFSPAPGLVHRFGDRLLALVTSSCPVRCRHCNRKRLWSRPERPADAEGLGRALAGSGRVREVILSGGEPLLLGDRALAALLEAARSRPGVELVRIHSRAPVALPERITPSLARLLARHAPLWFVTQVNCAAEIDPAVRRAFDRLRAAGVGLLNQATLLRGVNDSLRAQLALGRALVAAGVKPYYLFQLDRAAGTLHFQVPLQRGLRIMARLRAGHSGLLVPHYMADLPGRGGKVELGPDAVLGLTADGTWLRGADGRRHFYPDP